MKIRDRYVQGIGSVRAAGPKEPVGAAAALSRLAAASDSVQFSARSRDVQKARHVALHAPEIRASLVEEITGQLDRGEYNVTGAEVAPKLIREHLTSGFAL
jgi:flagellar biosynthesis anti-sigma factor FlgM